jgi:hypothetical protein
MMDRQIPTAITEEGLLGKSRVYIRRAFRAKGAGDLDEYQLWASLALELLGKAALAKIHSSLVVDPTHPESLFAASGIIVSADTKTINAATLYKRLGHLSKYFDTKVKEFCDSISLRRNSELHSGELPFHQMRLEAWEGRYWQAADIIVALLNSTLEEWIGADQARAPKELISAASEATIEAAKERVEQAKEHFLARPRREREEVLQLSKTKHAFHYPEMFALLSDQKWEVVCPACTGRAFLAGMEHGEVVLETEPGDEGWEDQGWEEEVEKQFGAEEFRCPTCDLRLDSRKEIEAAGIDPDHTEVVTRQREYEPDYGNE